MPDDDVDEDLPEEFKRLLRRLGDTQTEDEQAAARQALADFRDVRDMLDPDAGIVEHRPMPPGRPTSKASERGPAHYELGQGIVTMPDGTGIDEEELRRHMRPPAGESGQPLDVR